MNIVFEKNHQRAFGTFPLKGEVLRAAIEAAIAAGREALVLFTVASVQVPSMSA